MSEDKTVEWHHRLNGHEFEQALRDGKGWGDLVCCSPWGRKESDTTETEQHQQIAQRLKNLRFSITTFNIC